MAAAAIEEGVINPSTEVFDPPTYTVGDRVIRCASIWGHGHETFLEAIERSCNPVFAKLAAEDMDHEFLYKYLRLLVWTETGTTLSVRLPVFSLL